MSPIGVNVGTRNSPLSLAQTEEVVSELRAAFPDRAFAVVPLSTTGDSNKDAPLLSMEKGMFVKEIELALLRGEIDLAVHSAKDLTVELPEGLVLAAVGPRRDPRDALVSKRGLTLAQLPSGARLGTSSPRRTALLKALRPDIEVAPIRGNVGTRLDKARSDDYDGVVVAAVALARLGRLGEVSEYLSAEEFTPEAGQGALAVQARAGDRHTLDMLAEVDHAPSNVALRAERAFLGALAGGCEVPVAAYARVAGAKLRISAMAALPDGSRVIRIHSHGEAADPADAGRRAADRLLKAGAGEIIEHAARGS